MLLDRFRLDDKIAVTTSGGRGLSVIIVLAFAKAGADIIVASRTQSELDTFIEQILSASRRAHPVAGGLGISRQHRTAGWSTRSKHSEN